MPDSSPRDTSRPTVDSLFLAILHVDPHARAAFLSTSCADARVRSEVESLLEAHERKGPFDSLLEELTERVEAVPGLASGQTVGVYRIVGELGRGGMGEVYLAERATGDFEQVVAIKLMGAGWNSPARRQRFNQERRILARLEHPGIARLVDGGVTPDRVPYFAMEYVEGTPIDVYCEKHNLSVGRRLDLFVAICQAVQYAHQNLVVHRDLKPSNILVTADGHPKLLDFGIAKLIDPTHLSAGSTKTAPWFTPDYAAPEVIRGNQVSTLSDVYSLGVVLYELLTGQRPRVSDPLAPWGENLGFLPDAPERPSMIAGRVGRNRLQRRLQGDLDTIVLKALATEPSRRYDSVERFADDIRRHQRGRPVLAQPDTVAYRLRKFVTRHRTAVAAAAVGVVSLVGGGAGSLWQASVARRERDQAQEARRQAEGLTGLLVGLFEDSDPQRTRGDTVAAREILRRGLARVDELQGQPVVQANLLDVLGQVYEGLGEYDRAEEILRRSVGLLEATIGTDDPAVAQSLNHIGEVLRRKGEYQTAENLYLRALEIQRQALGADHPDVAETLNNLGFLMPYLARDDESVAYRRMALEVLRRHYPDDHELVTATMVSLGSALRITGDYRGSEAQYRTAIELRKRRLGAEHPLVGEAMLGLGDVLWAHLDGAEEAESLYREALALYRRGDGPDAPDLGHPLSSLADLLEERGSYAEAEALVHEALALHESRLGPEHPLVAETKGHLALLALRQGRSDEAEALLRSAEAVYVAALGPAHTATAGIRIDLARTLAAQGADSTAESMVRDALATVERVSLDHPQLARGRYVLARLLVDRGELVRAEELLSEALAVSQRRRIRADDPVVVDIYRALVEVYDKLGEPDRADRYRASAQNAKQD